jgi:hypothetical protein
MDLFDTKIHANPTCSCPHCLSISDEAEFFCGMEEYAPQTSKDAPRTYELSKEDIDLIEGWFGDWACNHSDKALYEQHGVLAKLGRRSNL